MLNTWILSIIVFGGVLASLEFGFRLGRREIARGGSVTSRGLTAIESAVFALLGLLLAFSFSGAAARFEARRHLITTEVNAIGTAWLRLDLLPPDSQPSIRRLFRSYTTLRATLFQRPLDEATLALRQKAAADLQDKIWRGVAGSLAANGTPNQSSILLLPALNSMFDIAATRRLAMQNHPPPIISLLLIEMTFLGATLAGFGMADHKPRNRFHRILFGTVMTLTIAVIADLEYPRRGFLRIDAADQALVELAHTFESAR